MTLPTWAHAGCLRICKSQLALHFHTFAQATLARAVSWTLDRIALCLWSKSHIQVFFDSFTPPIFGAKALSGPNYWLGARRGAASSWTSSCQSLRCGEWWGLLALSYRRRTLLCLSLRTASRPKPLDRAWQGRRLCW